MRRIFQHEGPGLVEHARGVDAAQGRDRFGQPLEGATGLRVPLLVGYPDGECAHQHVGAGRRAQLSVPDRPFALRQRREVVLETGEPDPGPIQPAAGGADRGAERPLRQDMVVAVHQQDVGRGVERLDRLQGARDPRRESRGLGR